MLRQYEVTPVLYGIANRIPARIIREKWDQIVIPAQTHEHKIADAAFKVSKFVREQMMRNQECGLRVFETILLHDEELIFEEDIREKLSLVAFDVYWEISINPKYTDHLEGLITKHDHKKLSLADHHAFAERWCGDYPHLVKYCREQIDRCLQET